MLEKLHNLTVEYSRSTVETKSISVYNTKLPQNLIDAYSRAGVIIVSHDNETIFMICKGGHLYDGKISSLRKDGGRVKTCTLCYMERRLNDFKELANKHGFTCVATTFVDEKTAVECICPMGHKVPIIPNNLKYRGTGCGVCVVRRKLKLEDMDKLAHERGGECLSETFVSVKHKLIWRCANGHIINASANNVRCKRHWCDECEKIKRLEEMKCIAKERGGECLSEKYINSETKLLWRCSCKYEWPAAPHDIKRGTWCPDCAKKAPITMEHMHQIAKERGGKCHSTVYDPYEKLLWECSEGHMFKLTGNRAKCSGQWCSYCKYTNEGECRRIIEEITGKEFIKSRPSWLNGLELDGYCEELELAFEYNGQQHYEYSEHFHRGDIGKFEDQVERDRIKLEICTKRGIKLIVIPYTVEDKREYILSQLSD